MNTCKKSQSLHKDVESFLSKNPTFNNYNKKLVASCYDLYKNKHVMFKDEFLDACGFNGRYKLFRFQEELIRKGVAEPDIYGNTNEVTFMHYMNKLDTRKSRICNEIYIKMKNMF